MRSLLVICFSVLSAPLWASGHNVLELRRLYYKANEDKASSELFCTQMEMLEAKGDALLLCYKGVARMMAAKHRVNPYKKLTLFQEGRELLEDAVRRDPANTEVRFMRFCVQSQAPGILGYSSNMKEDKRLLLQRWPGMRDADLKGRIRSFLLRYGECSAAEKQVLEGVVH